MIHVVLIRVQRLLRVAGVQMVSGKASRGQRLALHRQLKDVALYPHIPPGIVLAGFLRLDRVRLFKPASGGEVDIAAVPGAVEEADRSVILIPLEVFVILRPPPAFAVEEFKIIRVFARDGDPVAGIGVRRIEAAFLVIVQLGLVKLVAILVHRRESFDRYPYVFALLVHDQGADLGIVRAPAVSKCRDDKPVHIARLEYGLTFVFAVGIVHRHPEGIASAGVVIGDERIFAALDAFDIDVIIIDVALSVLRIDVDGVAFGILCHIIFRLSMNHSVNLVEGQGKAFLSVKDQHFRVYAEV